MITQSNVKIKIAVSLLVSILFVITFQISKYNGHKHAGQELSGEMLNKISQYESGSIKEIDFSTMTHFSWDTLYIMGPYSSCNHIVKTLESPMFWFECKLAGVEHQEYKNLFVFTKNEHIVQYFSHTVSVTNSDFSSALNKDRFSYKEAVFILDEGRMIWRGNKE
jgi:hypothetical protein